MTSDFHAYIDKVDPHFRPLFDRVHRLIDTRHPDVTHSISYGIPTYRSGSGRLYLGAWNHGISLYGWRAGGDGGFAERHPDLITGKGTIRLTPEAAALITDDELIGLIDAVLGAPPGPDATVG